MKNYVIHKSGSKIEVFGTIKHNDKVHIDIDNEEYAVLKISDGDYTEEPGCAKLELDEGGYIKENPTTQEIKLQDGLKIKKSSVSKSVKLPHPETDENKNLKSSNNKISLSKVIVDSIIKIMKR